MPNLKRAAVTSESTSPRPTPSCLKKAKEWVSLGDDENFVTAPRLDAQDELLKDALEEDKDNLDQDESMLNMAREIRLEAVLASRRTLFRIRRRTEK